MLLIAKLGDAIAVTHVTVNIIMRLRVRRNRTFRAAHPRLNGLRSNPPASLIPLLPRNLPCMYVPRRGKAEWLLNARTNIHSQRPWKSEGNLSALRVTVLSSWAPARQLIWFALKCRVIAIRVCMGMGFAKVNLYPTSARLKFGDRRIGEAKYAADIKVGIAGRGGAFTTLVRDADIPALLCKWGP